MGRQGHCSNAVFASATRNLAIQGACANQTSDNNLGAWTFAGWNIGNCSRGNEFCDMYNTLSARGIQSTSIEESNHNITTSGQTSNSTTFTISTISGSMQATSGMISSFSVKAWLPANENDTTIDANELLYNGMIVIRHGQVDLVGNFAADFVGKYSTTTSGSTIKVDFNGSNLVFRLSIPRGRSVSEVSIIGEVDGAPIAPSSSMTSPEGFRFLSPSAISNVENGRIKFSTFPNPTKDGFSINFKSNLETNISVKIFNIDGKLVSELINKEVKKDEELIFSTENLKLNLPAGTYFIILDDGKEYYTKQQIITD